MCTYPVQPICTFSCTSLFILIFINPQYTVLHILSHCTSYSLFYFIICSYFHSHLYLYIYSLVLCFIVLLLLCYFILFNFFALSIERNLSWLTFHYWLYPVWLCMWRIIKNLEPWTNWNIIYKIFFFQVIFQLSLYMVFSQVTLSNWHSSKPFLLVCKPTEIIFGFGRMQIPLTFSDETEKIWFRWKRWGLMRIYELFE